AAPPALQPHWATAALGEGSRRPATAVTFAAAPADIAAAPRFPAACRACSRRHFFHGRGTAPPGLCHCRRQRCCVGADGEAGSHAPERGAFSKLSLEEETVNVMTTRNPRIEAASAVPCESEVQGGGRVAEVV